MGRNVKKFPLKILYLCKRLWVWFNKRVSKLVVSQLINLRLRRKIL